MKQSKTVCCNFIFTSLVQLVSKCGVALNGSYAMSVLVSANYYTMFIANFAALCNFPLQ